MAACAKAWCKKRLLEEKVWQQMWAPEEDAKCDGRTGYLLKEVVVADVADGKKMQKCDDRNHCLLEEV
jgi:hypothetical protein